MEKEKKFIIKGIDNIDTAGNIIDDNISTVEHHHRLKSHKIGNLCLTLTTIALVIICLFVDASFAPFIVLLMSSRIGSSLYMVIKQKERKEIVKLIIWIALFSKSTMVCFQLMMF